MYFSLFIVVQRYLNTIIKGTAANTGDRIRDGDRGQTTAFIKGIVANIGDRIGDDDGGQATATIKGKFANAGDRVGNGDGGQATAIMVSITNYLSVLSLLNGRKVKTQIL